MESSDFIAYVFAFLLATVFAALIFFAPFRKDMLASEGETKVGPLSARGAAVVLICVILVGGMLISQTIPSRTAVVQVDDGANGTACQTSADCDSGYCYPAPGNRLAEGGPMLCLAEGLNCALPGLDGAMAGSEVSISATLYRCGTPADGSHARFSAAR